MGPIPQEPEAPVFLFRMYNRGRLSVRLREIRFALESGQVIALPYNAGLSAIQAEELSTGVIPPHTPVSVMQDIQLLARDIRAKDDSAGVQSELVIEDTTMRAHKIPVSATRVVAVVQGLEHRFPTRSSLLAESHNPLYALLLSSAHTPK